MSKWIQYWVALFTSILLSVFVPVQIAMATGHGNTPSSLEQTDTPTPTPEPTGSPELVIADWNLSDSKVRAGERLDLSVAIKNVTRISAQNVRVSLSEDDSPALRNFSIYKNSGSLRWSDIGGKDLQQGTFYLKVNPDAASRTYNLNIKMTYEDERGTRFDAMEMVSVSVNSLEKPNVIISDVDISNDPIVAGDRFEVTVTLENRGEQIASNITIGINEEGGGSPFSPYLSGSSISLGSKKLETGEKTRKTFSLGSNTSAVPGINNLYLTLRYQDDHDKSYSATQIVGIPTKKATPEEVLRPKLIVSNSNTFPQQVEVGRKFSLQLEIENYGNQTARSVKIVASHVEGASGLDVFFPKQTSNALSLRDLRDGGRIQRELEFMVSPKAQAKTYNLVVELEYQDIEGRTYTASEVVAIPLYKEGKTFITESRPQVLIQSRSLSVSPVSVGKKFSLSLTVLNPTNSLAKNIRISLEDESGNLKNFSPVTNSNVIYIPELAAGKRFVGNFPLLANKDIPSNVYNLTARIMFEDANGNQLESFGMVSVPVKGEDNKQRGPELTVVSYSLPREGIKIGSPFQLTLKVKNIGDQPVKNAKVALTNMEGTETQTYSPIGTSNTLSIDSIGPGETKAKSITYLLSGSEKLKVYNMAVTMSYTSKDGTKKETQEIIGIPTQNEQLLKIATFMIPERVKPDEKFSIFAEYINLGSEPLTNLLVKFSGDFQVDQPSYFLGKFDAGNTDVYEAKAEISKPGFYKGEILFTYTDIYHQERTIKKPFTIVVDEAYAQGVMAEASESEEPGFWARFWEILLSLFGLG